MKDKIYLRNADYTIDFKKYIDEDEVIEKVKQDFGEYTRGTSREYRNCDRLSYIDMIRERLYPNFDVWQEEYVKGYLRYQRDTQGYLPKIEIEFDEEFAEQAYQDGKRPFYKADKNPRKSDVLALIVKTVMNWEENIDEEE